MPENNVKCIYKSKINSIYRSTKSSKRLCQGDILKDLQFAIGNSSSDSIKDLVFLNFAVVLSQDCDLQSDFLNRKGDHSDQDKYLSSILVCPAYKIEEFAQGCHLNDWKMKPFYQKEIEKLHKNDEFKRYHYLPGETTKFFVPELVLDFKHFFTLPRDFLYRQKKDKYVASLSELFREELSQRFSNYLSRIGLPKID